MYKVFMMFTIVLRLLYKYANTEHYLNFSIYSQIRTVSFVSPIPSSTSLIATY